MAASGGAIVNLSSAAARLGSPGQYVDYAASKGAIDSFTIGLAKEVAAEGIRVNAVRPGLIDTEIHASGGLPDRASQLAPTVPMQRTGSAEEVAAGHRVAAVGRGELRDRNIPGRDGRALMATPTMDLIKPLITLLAIVNPLAIVPFFIHYTQGYTESHRKRTAWVAAFSAFVVIAVCALLGLRLLAFFGISIASFQVGGGMLLLISSLNMLNAQPAESKTSEDELRAAEVKASLGASIAVVPLTIPLLTGPATMSTVVIYADKTQHLWELAILVGYGVVIGLATGVTFSLAEPIARVLGKTGINVMTRLMGLILAALAVEVMADGLSTLFPALRARRVAPRSAGLVHPGHQFRDRRVAGRRQPLHAAGRIGARRRPLRREALLGQHAVAAGTVADQRGAQAHQADALRRRFEVLAELVERDPQGVGHPALAAGDGGAFFRAEHGAALRPARRAGAGAAVAPARRLQRDWP